MTDLPAAIAAAQHRRAAAAETRRAALALLAVASGSAALRAWLYRLLAGRADGRYPLLERLGARGDAA